MDGRGEVRMALDGARQGRRDGVSRREAGAASVKYQSEEAASEHFWELLEARTDPV